MGRAPCCDKKAVKKGPWSKEEDQILINYVNRYGHGNWRQIPKNAGLMRCGKSCRLRWMNYLRPDIKRGRFTSEEELVIVKLHKTFGNRWASIAASLPGRTDNEIKNIWHTRLKKRLHEFDIPADNQVADNLKNDSASSFVEAAPAAEDNEPATNNILPPHSSSSSGATGAAAAPNNPSDGSAGLTESDFPLGDDDQFWTQKNDRPENDKSGFEFNGADVNPTTMDNDDVGGVDPGSLKFWQDHLLTWTDDEFMDLWN